LVHKVRTKNPKTRQYARARVLFISVTHQAIGFFS
jgi:hypothetical protein